ncbi:MAG: hypothetical protein ACRCYT_08730 [Cetobacterium sp.]
MNMKRIKLNDYEVDSLKFLEVLANGVFFKSKYFNVNINKKNGKDDALFEQTLQYKLSDLDFLEINYDQLIELKILKKK